MIIVVLEIVVCLILAGLVGGLTGWFLQRLKTESSKRAAERLLENLQEAEGALLDVKAESRIHAARAEKLETEIRSRAIAAQALENEASSLRTRLSMAETGLDTSGKERDELARGLEQVRNQLTSASAQITEARLKLAEQERTTERMQQTIEELTQTQAISVTTLAEKVREIDKLHAQLAEESSRHHTVLMEKADEIAASQERTAELEAQLAQIHAAEERMEERSAHQRTAREERERGTEEIGSTVGTDPDTQTPIAEAADVEAGDNDAGLPSSVGVLPDEASDDLKQIPGIGPKLEQLLHSIGVRTFRQMALWSDEDIDHVDAHLERFHGRIRRERWVESAREEFSRKYGKQPEEM